MSLASFFQNVEAKAEAWIVKEYNTVIRPLVQKAGPVLKQLEKATEEEAIQYGIPIVLSFFGPAGQGLSGLQKMGAALPQLISALGTVGKQIAVDDANAVLQIIVNKIRSAAADAQASTAAAAV